MLDHLAFHNTANPVFCMTDGDWELLRVKWSNFAVVLLAFLLPDENLVLSKKSLNLKTCLTMSKKQFLNSFPKRIVDAAVLFQSSSSP